jgi:hypothetical protein
MQTETQTDVAVKIITKTKCGKFPGAALEKLRATKGNITITAIAIETPNPKNPEKTKKGIVYDLHHVDANNNSQFLGTAYKFEDAKNLARSKALDLQCAFDVPVDYKSL